MVACKGVRSEKMSRVKLFLLDIGFPWKKRMVLKLGTAIRKINLIYVFNKENCIYPTNHHVMQT